MAKLLKSVKEKFAFWAIAFLLFFLPLYPKFPLFSVSDTYVSIRLEDVLIASIVFIFALILFLKKDFSFLKWPLTKLLGLYFLIGLLAVLNAIFITKNVIPHLVLLHFLRRFEYISLLFVAYFSFFKKKQLKTFGWILATSTFGVIFYALGQKFFGWPVVSTMNKEFSKGMILRLTWWARVNSTFAGHYDLAAYMVMILCLIIAVLTLVKNWKTRLMVFFLGLLSFYIILLTASRVSFGAYLVGGLFVLFLAKKKWWVIPFLVFSILGMVFSEDLGQRYAATFKIDLSFLSGVVLVRPRKIALAPTLTPIPTPSFTGLQPTRTHGMPIPTETPTPTPTQPVATASGEYFEPTELAVGRSTDIRLKVEWPRAVRAFLKNPLLGTGYSSITLATDNDYLRLIGESGILGVLAFSLVILEIAGRIILFLKSKAGREEKLLIIGFVGASVGYFLNATFIDVFESSKVAFFFWIMMGVGLRLIDLNSKH
ncbi:hypothetical protein COS55_03680 [Candidatus Shapirobacteria bacterium CG03_land_8_20_14_0_80_40_19]|uniref:O-antigen ligase-related domain-containing protein n=4 Tax=Candidatus Shapironibacteriota TaxID=1752721 RepID=A0A2M7BB70_9BACT|nr:MAG: hypothetical protein COV89_01945 [Candidatus Shapirobacteria bacterium CG11_big_fil_rev_8_21_14_0_20_40_12]PIV00352.1 MAG: hypothetical protein COS55_03680 [Candidatus Shapirobacteria bacterium CG03_land_8_20_14_0_80_40_19]PJC28750.1 MAG: hypothetical protein CO053_02995 [Candidatus Shapirobacteria bacterium CG_4_9_14_0_2_um_filter_40_11]PJC76058.1 MAG: hypothetical protein CO010_03560 [Candidatus Shapirobacteria bacterium CG_4_8_14_3_um_filter_39_11]